MILPTSERYARLSGHWDAYCSWVAYAARSGYSGRVDLGEVRDAIVKFGTVGLVMRAAAMLDPELQAAFFIVLDVRPDSEQIYPRIEGRGWLNRLDKLLELGTGYTLRPGDWSDTAVARAIQLADTPLQQWEIDLLTGS